MSRIIVVNSVTLDGVMQAPARPDEDTRGGFAYGGWAVPYSDASMARSVAEGMDKPGHFLLGRRTYEDFASVWPNQPADNPFAAVLNNRMKYVVSTTLQEPLPWRNSTLLTGDVAEAVARLKEQSEADITILGSGTLVQSLLPHNLIDEFQLRIHPLILGSGRRLFPDGGAYAALRLVDTKTTTTGVVVATYQSTAPAAE